MDGQIVCSLIRKNDQSQIHELFGPQLPVVGTSFDVFGLRSAGVEEFMEMALRSQETGLRVECRDNLRLDSDTAERIEMAVLPL